MKFHTTALFLAGGVLLGPTVHAQTLAEASEAAKQIHHDWPLSGNTGPKVYTNADLPANLATHSTVSTVAPASGAARTAAPEDLKKTKAYWQARLAQRLPRLAAAVRALELATDALQRAQALYAGMQTASGRAMAAISVRNAVINGDRCVADVKAAQASIEDVHEEARHLGVLPGWLR
jgi:hypothetical protein